MNYIDGAGLSLVADPSATQDPSGSFVDTLPWLAAAVCIWYVEASARGRRGGFGQLSSGCLPSCSQLVRRYAPETAGLAVCLALAAVLRAKGDRTPVDPSEQAAWEEIQNQWPILSTADSLFALQAMLRVLLLLSAILRPSGAHGAVDMSPLSGSTALFYFLAGALRVVLLFVSPDHGLEGPLSGPTYIAFEVAALPLLFKLAFGATSNNAGPWRPLAALAKLLLWGVAVAAAAIVASQNRLPLAEDALLNGLFTMVSLLELVAALSCLLCTVVSGGGGMKGSFASFAHVVLPIQQSLSMYFFLTAFDMTLEKASVGKPLTLLQWTGAVEMVLLLLAGAAHVVMAVDAAGSEEDASRPLATTIF